LVPVFGLAALGCGGGDLVLPNTRAPAAVAIEGGDGQNGTAGTTLPDPLVVRVTDAAERSVEGASVEFSASGGSDLVPGTAVTGADGRATATWTLGAEPGTQTATARVVDPEAATGLDVTFTATALPSAPRRETETAIGTDPDPSDEGEEVTIFAAVRASGGGDRPGGTVLIYDQSARCGEGELLGRAELNTKGQGTITTSRLTVGFHTIRGCYAGTAEFEPSDDIAYQRVRND
jgi:hypothetical protein